MESGFLTHAVVMRVSTCSSHTEINWVTAPLVVHPPIQLPLSAVEADAIRRTRFKADIPAHSKQIWPIQYTHINMYRSSHIFFITAVIFVQIFYVCVYLSAWGRHKEKVGIYARMFRVFRIYLWHASLLVSSCLSPTHHVIPHHHIFSPCLCLVPSL